MPHVEFGSGGDYGAKVAASLEPVERVGAECPRGGYGRGGDEGNDRAVPRHGHAALVFTEPVQELQRLKLVPTLKTLNRTVRVSSITG